MAAFHRNPFWGFGAPGGQNLAFPITVAIRFYNRLYYRTSRDRTTWDKQSMPSVKSLTWSNADQVLTLSLSTRSIRCLRSGLMSLSSNAMMMSNPVLSWLAITFYTHDTTAAIVCLSVTMMISNPVLSWLAITFCTYNTTAACLHHVYILYHKTRHASMLYAVPVCLSVCLSQIVTNEVCRIGNGNVVTRMRPTWSWWAAYYHQAKTDHPTVHPIWPAFQIFSWYGRWQSSINQQHTGNAYLILVAWSLAVLISITQVMPTWFSWHGPWQY